MASGLVAGAMVVAAACAPPPLAEPAPPPSGEESATALPPMLEAVDPTPAQRKELAALVASLERDLEPAQTATADFARALARAARRCRQDSPFIEMEASHTITVGEQTRGKVLDAINRLHATLTPAQRRAFARRLLGDEKDAEKSRDDRDASRTRSIGDDLDLSIGQMLSILLRVRKLRDDFEEKAAPWRERYVQAVRAFERSDFDVRDHAIAELPLVSLMTDFVRDAFRVLMPLLEPPQCETLGRIIEERVAD